MPQPPSPEELKRLREEKERKKREANLLRVQDAIVAEANRNGISREEQLERIQNEWLSSKEKSEAALPVQAGSLVITVTSDEKKAILERANLLEIPHQERRGPSSKKYDVFSVEDRRIAHHNLAGNMGPSAMTMACLSSLAETQATSIFLIGFAFGADSSSQKIGDVIVAESVHKYDRRDVFAAPETCRVPWGYRYKEEAPPRCDEGLVRSIIEANSAVQPRGFEVICGPLLSGGARIECSRYKEFLLQCFRGAVGGDMEACALADIAQSDPLLQWVVIKGIGDFAEDVRPNLPKHRTTATDNAANVFWTYILTKPTQKKP